MGLSDGVRIAVIGGGPSGAAFAGSLLSQARACRRSVDLTVYAAPHHATLKRPVVLDPEARARLTGLGATIPAHLRAVELRGIAVQGGGRSTLLSPPAGGLWVIDGIDGQSSGQVVLEESLGAAAALRGAKFEQRMVDAVEARSDGQVVRAGGSAARFDLVVGAFGAGSALSSNFLGGSQRSPRRLFCAEARIRLPAGASLSDVLVASFSPTPEIAILYLVPCGAEAYAIGVGADVSTAALMRALMVLGRDGLMPAGFDVVATSRRALSCGGSRAVVSQGRLALGSAVSGSLLESGLIPALVGSVRTAEAVLQHGLDPSKLLRAIAKSQDSISRAAEQQRKALYWARHAAERLPSTLAALAERPLHSVTPGMFGLPSLPIPQALSALRWESGCKALSELFWLKETPAPLALPPAPLIFVVDDDDDAREALVEYLQSRGLPVRGFANEAHLLEAAARERPTAILLDTVLRWVDGMSLCRELKRHPATRQAHLISMSGLSRPSDREAALAAGAEAFFPKPLNLEELWRVVAGFVPGAPSANATPLVPLAQGT